jgi:hypothetical protein
LAKLRRSQRPKRYSRPIPGDSVQMDTMKIAPCAHQYTAVDDCLRFRVLAIHRSRNARNSSLFLDRVILEMPFSIQRIQTDRCGEVVQRRLMSEHIKFRPILARSPHLNGKVERSQLTDLAFSPRSDRSPFGDDDRPACCSTVSQPIVVHRIRRLIARSDDSRVSMVAGLTRLGLGLAARSA